jgi:hypothetical protein
VKAEAKQPVEAGYVIHMGMRDEDVAHPQQFTGRESAHITEIEENRPTAIPKIQVNTWVAERVVHKAGLNKPTHAAPTALTCPAFPIEPPSPDDPGSA